MSWFSLAALILSGFVVVGAARVRGGPPRGLIATAVACAALTAAVLVVIRFGPGAGLLRVLAVGVPGLACIACYWAVHLHIESSQPGAGFRATLLGFGMFCLAFLMQFGERGLIESWNRLGEGPGADDERRISAQASRLAERERELEQRLKVGIPEFRAGLEQQAGEVGRELATAPASVGTRLEWELKEIVRLLLALEQEEKALDELLARLRQEQRRLARLAESQNVLGEHDELLTELDEVWSEAGQRLSRPLDDRLGVGVLAESLVAERMQKWRQR